MSFLSRVHKFGGAFVSLWGPDNRHFIHRQLVASMARTVDPNRICYCKSPSNENFPGFKVIISYPHFSYAGLKPDEYAEGILLTEPGSAGFTTTADCQFLVLYEKTRHWLLFTHAGRAAMTPELRDGEITNIVTHAYLRITQGLGFPQVSAYITGAICPEHFVHDDERGRELTRPFLELFGDTAFADDDHTQLDLPTVTKTQLIGFGVDPENITIDEVCTYETPWLASYRRATTNPLNADDKPENRNLVAATLLPRR